MEYWVRRNCFLSSPIFWKAHILRLQFSSLVFINQRKFETKLLFLFLDFKFPYKKLIFFMCDEVYYSLCKRKHCEISIIYWNIDYIFCLFYWNLDYCAKRRSTVQYGGDLVTWCNVCNMSTKNNSDSEYYGRDFVTQNKK